MTKREWKYLRLQYQKRRSGFRFISYTITTPKAYDGPKMVDWLSDEPFGNFAMMIPKEPYKPQPFSKPIRTRSQIRFNIPLFSGISTTDGKKKQHIYTTKDGIQVITNRSINPLK